MFVSLLYIHNYTACPPINSIRRENDKQSN